MEIKINVDESMFKDVLDKELKALTPEQIHEIICKALETYLSKPDVMESLVFRKDSYYGNKYPSEIMKETFKSIDLKTECTEVTSSVMTALKANGGKILIDLVISAFANSLFNQICNRDEFNAAIDNNVRAIVSGMLNNNR